MAAFKNLFKQRGGFSALELSIVLIVLGFLIVPFYSILLGASRLEVSNDPIEVARSGLAEYVRIFGAYPCPAPLNAAPTSTNYLTATCTTGAGGVITTPGAGGVGNVLIGTLPIQQLRVAMGCEGATAATPITALQNTVLRQSIRTVRDIIDTATNDAGGAGAAADNDITDLTDKTACLDKEDLFDKHGNKILYAVTQAATVLGGFDPINPAAVANIQILNAVGGNATNTRQLFALVSHGKDGKGAFTVNGAQQAVCTSVAGLDQENCDNDAVFMDAQYSEAAGATTYYDDRIDFSIAGVLREDNYWNWSAAPTGSTAPAMYANNVTVVMGRGQPHAANDRLVVKQGDLRVEAGNVTADRDVIATRATVIDANGNPVLDANGNPTFTSGNVVSSSANVIAGGDITATNGDIAAANDVVSGNDIIVGKGDITQPDGTTVERGGDIEATQDFYATQYCYDPPLTANCGAP